MVNLTLKTKPKYRIIERTNDLGAKQYLIQKKIKHLFWFSWEYLHDRHMFLYTDKKCPKKFVSRQDAENAIRVDIINDKDIHWYTTNYFDYDSEKCN